MKTIFKYPLTPGSTDVMLPEGSKLLTVQMQHGEPMLWALVDTARPKKLSTIVVYGTGHLMPDDPGDYIATFQMEEGNLVWHAFVAQSGKGDV